nr:unnamed protein product [Spirometra erinaceieuropaei]
MNQKSERSYFHQGICYQASKRCLQDRWDSATDTTASEAQPHAIPAAQSLQSGLTVKSETGSGAGRQEIPVRVLLLDGEEVTLKMDRQAMGHELMSRVCDGQDIIEYDYFGLTYTDKRYGTWFWLDLDKKIIKQISDTADWQFFFQVKFYPPEPAMLQDEITRYQLVLQVRQDVYTGKLPCSWVTQALLGSFVAQSEVGDYDPNLHHDTEYLKKFEFVRAPTEQLLQKISELHANNKGMKPAQSDMKYLETAKRLELYGLDLHPARDLENVEIYIGVGFSGVVIYRDRIRIGRFAWPKVLRISYKKENFFLKIRPDYAEPVEATVGFRLPNPHLAKRLWKSAVEHHAFFRLKEPRLQKHSPNGPFSLKLGSRHQYSGKTFFQYRTTNIDRPITDSERVQRGERAASVPASLNRAGLQYSSMHSLNRTHPRDMTIGKSTSRDYFGPTRAPPASLEELTGGEDNLCDPTMTTEAAVAFREKFLFVITIETAEEDAGEDLSGGVEQQDSFAVIAELPAPCTFEEMNDCPILELLGNLSTAPHLQE